jgi:ribosomal subunit interface protein
MEKSELINNILDKDIEKIERRIQMFRDNDSVHLSVHIEKNPHREQYFCRAHLYMPSRIVKADSCSSKFSKTINQSFAALSRQLGKIKYKVERHLRKQKKTGQDQDEL